MGFFDTDGARIHYETWGEPGARPAVTLINGHTRTMRDFRAMANHLTERGWHVVSLDNRGAGETRTSRPFALRDMADDIEALWRHTGVRRSHVLGISLGGMIAMALAARQPSPLVSLALVSTTARWEADSEDLASGDPALLEQRLMRYFAPDFARRQKLLIQAMIRELAKAFQDEAKLAMTREQKAAYRGFDGRASLSRVSVPTLVLHGSEDQIMPVERARETAMLIPGAELEIVEGVGHLLLAEAAPKLYSSAASFFSRVESR